jgi:predicted ATPase
VISSSDLNPGGLVGRAAETTAIRRALHQSSLVTVTGLPGVGKTAASIAAAAVGGTGRFSDGVRLIRLDALTDDNLLPHTIAAALRLPGMFAVSSLSELTAQLSARRLLIVLDTCEHVLGACTTVASAITLACPGVRILATSREPLRVPGEQTLTVLPLPPREAARLLRQRAQLSGPLETETAEAICAKLDCLPLAIGLAARQLGNGTVDALLAGLDSGYDFLSDPDTTVPRHKTLSAAIGWSHQLCTPAERLLWARLSVFDRPFCIKDCQEVCATTHLTAETVAVGVTMLAERSLVLREAGEPPRYVMPRTIRAYGMAMLRRLAEEEEMRRRYQRWRSGPRRESCEFGLWGY